MPNKNNKLIKFFNSYASETSEINNEATADNNVNYLTDKDLRDDIKGVVSSGIPYGSDAKSNIINSMLRQVTLITYNVAQLLAKHGDYDIDSTTSNENILASLEKSINTLATTVANDRISDSTKNNTAPTALTNSGEKLITEKTVFNAIKDNLTTEASGYILGANQGKALSAKITADISTETNARNTAISNASNAIKQDLKIKYLNNTTEKYTPSDEVVESGFLYIWKGTQGEYTTFLGKNSSIASRVFAIIE